MGPKLISTKLMTQMTIQLGMSKGMEWSMREVYGHGTETSR